MRSPAKGVTRSPRCDRQAPACVAMAWRLGSAYRYASAVATALPLHVRPCPILPPGHAEHGAGQNRARARPLAARAPAAAQPEFRQHLRVHNLADIVCVFTDGRLALRLLKATLGRGANIVLCWGSAMWTSTRPTSRTSWRTHRTTGSLRPADCYRTRIQRSCCSGAH